MKKTKVSKRTRRPNRSMKILNGTITLIALLGFCLASLPLSGDIPLTEKQLIQKKIKRKQEKKNRHKTDPSASTPFSTGAISLVDFSGMEWFLNTNITFSTSSSASAAASDATFTTAVMATTSGGGLTSSTLNDAFDGYNTLALSFNGSTGIVRTGSSSYHIFNQNGPPALEYGNRQLVYNSQVMDGIRVSRKVFVPQDDSFCRWLNIFTNQDSVVRTFNVITSNNLGSDSNTRIFASSDGTLSAETSDYWVGTMQNYSGSTSPDPRIGHVLQGPEAPVGLLSADFSNGDDNPYWSYSLTLDPGETAIIMNFAVALASKAAVTAKCEALIVLPETTLQGMTAEEISRIVNFNIVEEPDAYRVTFIAGEHGSISGRTRQNVAENGSTRPVTAVPDTGYTFNGWSGGYTGWDNPLTISRVRSNLTIRADFTNMAPAVILATPLNNTAVFGTVVVRAHATDDSGIMDVVFSIDGSAVHSDTSPPYTFNWNTLTATDGPHLLRVLARDAAGTTATDEATVLVRNLVIALTGTRKQASAWIIRRDYAHLGIAVENPGPVAVSDYQVCRSENGAEFVVLSTISPSSLVNNNAEYLDRYIESGSRYTYKVTARDASGTIIRVSNAIEL